jgi:hypothetical protein
MISFTSAFRGLFIALTLIALIELLIAINGFRAPKFESMLSYKYIEGDVGQKQVVNEKLKTFVGKPAEFIHVGDSSGYYGVQSKIIEKYLPGMTYLNIGCCADTGFAGYSYIAEYLLKNNKKAKYLVFYMSPYSMPMHYKEGFSDILYRSLLNPFRFVDELPSLNYRHAVTDYVYYSRIDKNLWMNVKEVSEKKGEKSLMEQWIEQYPKTNGWVPVPDSPNRGIDVPTEECDIAFFFDEQDNDTLKPELKRLKAVADKYKVKLIMLFNPVACTPGLKIQPILDSLNDFWKNNPDVIVPFPFIKIYPRNSFFDRWHLLEAGSIKYSKEIGKKLAEIINKDSPNKSSQNLEQKDK